MGSAISCAVCNWLNKMDKSFWLKKAASALAITIIIRVLALPFTSACPQPLQCVNFTEQDKRSDCEYIISDGGLSYDEEQDVLCILWDQGYGFNGYHPPDYPPLDNDLTLDWNEIDTSTFITSIKIFLFFLLNYFIYSVLTKPQWVRKWLYE